MTHHVDGYQKNDLVESLNYVQNSISFAQALMVISYVQDERKLKFQKEKYIEIVNNYENNAFYFCIPLDSVSTIFVVSGCLHRTAQGCLKLKVQLERS